MKKQYIQPAIEVLKIYAEEEMMQKKEYPTVQAVSYFVTFDNINTTLVDQW